MPESGFVLDQKSVGGWDGVTLTGVAGPGCLPRIPQAVWRGSHTAICIPQFVNKHAGSWAAAEGAK